MRNGWAAAEFDLASLYDQGIGGDEDKRAAAELYLRAVNRGDLQAQARLARLYIIGAGVPKDMTRGRALLHGAFGKSKGDAEFNFANLHLNGKYGRVDYDLAYDSLHIAAEAGSEAAENQLLKLYLVEFFKLEVSDFELPGKLDNSEVISWIEARASEGNPAAAVILGNVYERGQGVSRDLQKGAMWRARADALVKAKQQSSSRRQRITQ